MVRRYEKAGCWLVGWPGESSSSSLVRYLNNTSAFDLCFAAGNYNHAMGRRFLLDYIFNLSERLTKKSFPTIQESTSRCPAASAIATDNLIWRWRTSTNSRAHPLTRRPTRTALVFLQQTASCRQPKEDYSPWLTEHHCRDETNHIRIGYEIILTSVLHVTKKPQLIQYDPLTAEICKEDSILLEIPWKIILPGHTETKRREISKFHWMTQIYPTWKGQESLLSSSLI